MIYLTHSSGLFYSYYRYTLVTMHRGRYINVTDYGRVRFFGHQFKCTNIVRVEYLRTLPVRRELRPVPDDSAGGTSAIRCCSVRCFQNGITGQLLKSNDISLRFSVRKFVSKKQQTNRCGNN